MELMMNVHYVMDGVPGFLKGIAQKEHMRCYNAFADASYDLYKHWNAEYAGAFGMNALLDITHYEAWVAKRAEEWVANNVHSPLMTFTVKPENNVLTGHLKHFPNSSIYFYMTEV